MREAVVRLVEPHYRREDADRAVAEVALRLAVEVEAPRSAAGDVETQRGALAGTDGPESAVERTPCRPRPARHRHDERQRAGGLRPNGDCSARRKPLVREAAGG